MKEVIKVLKRRGFKDLFEKEKIYYKKLAELPFEKKIKIVVKLHKIVKGLKPSEKKKNVGTKLIFYIFQIFIWQIQQYFHSIQKYNTKRVFDCLISGMVL